MIIRSGRREDLRETLAIYNYEVEEGFATFDIHPKTLVEWEEWYRIHQEKPCVFLVAEDTVNGRVCGYATLSGYRPKEAYRSTVEVSVYVSPDRRGEGIGSLLLEQVIDAAREDRSIRMLVSVITGGNEASIRLHEKFAFTYSGTLHCMGYKRGRWLDIVNYEKEVLA